MAVIPYTVTRDQNGLFHTVVWTGVTEADTCAAYLFQQLPQDISVEFDGTWGGATATLVGSNGGGGKACTAIGGTTADWTADALVSVLERPKSFTPTFAGGSSQSMSVYMVVWLK